MRCRVRRGFPTTALMLVLLLGLLAIVTAACGGGSDRFVATQSDAPFVPVIESTEIVIGQGRLVFTLLDRSQPPRFPDGARFVVRYFDPAAGGVRFRAEHPLDVITVGGETFYLGPASCDVAGRWETAITAVLPDGSTQTSARLPFIVELQPVTPAVGADAVPVPTLTQRDGPLSEITSDPDPDPALYETSIVDALTQGRPFVVVFSTVGFCFGSDTCQRAVDQVKRLAPQADLLTIHAEPLSGLNDADGPYPSESNLLNKWRLQNDPWIFVVDGSGVIRAKFEVVVSDAELLAALQLVAR